MTLSITLRHHAHIKKQRIYVTKPAFLRSLIIDNETFAVFLQVIIKYLSF